MTGQSAGVPLLAVALAWIAGATDAIGFIETGGFFVSFMSGNSTRLGIGLGTPVRALAGTTGAIVILFVVGVTVATLIGRRLGTRGAGAMLLVQAALLALGVGLLRGGWHGAAIAVEVIAMAFANTVLGSETEGSLAVTYVTGALVRIGRGLADAIAGGAAFGWVPHLFLWAGLVAGAASGAAAEARWGAPALWLPAAASLIAALSQWPRTRYAQPARGPGGRRPD